MKKLVAIVSTLIFAWCFSAQAALITLTPSTGIVTLGNSFTVDLTVSDLGPGEELALFDLDADFDPGVFDLISIDFGTALGGPADSLAIPTIPNAFENSFLSEAELQALQAAPFTILTLTFDTLATSAASVLSTTVNIAGFLDFVGDDIDVTVQTTTVTVIDPPVTLSETGTLFLIFFGLCALIRRRL